ncbi:hypothetical protein D3C77_377480 [compost metagenome]
MKGDKLHRCPTLPFELTGLLHKLPLPGNIAETLLPIYFPLAAFRNHYKGLRPFPFWLLKLDLGKSKLLLPSPPLIVNHLILISVPARSIVHRP